MKILADQDVYAVTVKWLKDKGHDVITAKDLGMSTASDEDLLKKATTTNRIMLTRDKDFGTLVFLRSLRDTGVILLRITPSTINETHKEIDVLFQKHDEAALKGLFCVVEPHCHRVRHISREEE